ncbi:hypothetical protein Q4Q34_07805 [Flavivirga abyssicola]|uniref:hypothetical protein n=1 Tax=Flavivirga abyssicola TaxID=3063533 RepID=UPI0026DFEBD1|nr:hypothetical protein [Flavivirga sp. MEBiC07777]WVK14930.1 hypothetical protein Q4Q34_07805 [Flavivirga sp. MEBiC07777]
MKNKTKTYALLALVLGIWGIIGYRIVSTINPSAPDVVQQVFEVSFNPKTNTKVDTFSIQVVNRDPFLGTLLVKKKPNKTVKRPTQPKVVWLPVLYHGSISKQNTKAKVFIVSINGQQNLMKIGQTINDVKLIKGNNNSITVTYKRARKTIQKT